MIFMFGVMFSYYGSNGSVLLPQQHHCGVVHGLTLLQCSIGCVLTQTTAGAKTRRVLRAWGGVCDATLSSFQLVLMRIDGNQKRRNNSSQLISALWELTCHMGSHSVTSHPAEVTFPPLSQPFTAGTRFSDPGGMQG